MPNPNYGDASNDVYDAQALDKSTMAKPFQQGAERLDKTGQRGNQDPGGNMPMRYGTANWKMPGGSGSFDKTGVTSSVRLQPRDRTWGMRQCDGVPYVVGLADPGESGLEEPFDWARGSVSHSRPSPDRAGQTPGGKK